MNYVAAAYAVTLGLIGLYTASVVARGRSARREAELRVLDPSSRAEAAAPPERASPQTMDEAGE